MKSFEFNKAKDIALDKREGKLVSGEIITNGFYGDAADVSRLVLQFGSHTKTFVLKDYDQQRAWVTDVKEAALHSLIVWEKIKALNLPTYTTYRLENNGAAILMTDLEKEGYSALSPNGAAPDWYDGETTVQKIHSIENFGNLIEEIKACAETASVAGLVLESDVYFVLVKELSPGSYSAKIFVGDFEGVSIPDGGSGPAVHDQDDINKSAEANRAKSLLYAAITLEGFVQSYMSEEAAPTYIKIIRSAFSEVV